MKRRKALLWLLGGVLLCAVLVAVYVYTPQLRGWYVGSDEEGAARYAGVDTDKVQLLYLLDEGDYRYTVWENRDTGALTMTVLEQQTRLDREYKRPWGSSMVNTPVDIYQYSESDGKTTQSLIVVTCDNRDGALTDCTLTFTEVNSGGHDRQWAESFTPAKPITLKTWWLSGEVRCTGEVL